MIGEKARYTLLRRNSSILSHTAEKHEEITIYKGIAGHGAHHGSTAVSLVLDLLVFLLLHGHDSLATPCDRSKHAHKSQILGQYGQKPAKIIKELYPSVNKE